jgi:hypothetical protein
MTFRYRLVDGKVCRELLASGFKRHSRGEERPQHFSRTIINALYQLECEQKFRSTFTKNQLKRIHERAIERWEQTGAET